MIEYPVPALQVSALRPYWRKLLGGNLKSVTRITHRDWREVRPDTVLGWLLRLPLRLIPRGTVLGIRFGVNRRAKWVIGTGVYSYWLGTYELEKQVVMKRVVKPGMTVFDIGANAGFYTLFFSRLVGDRGQVWAFEPLPENGHNILRHIRLNRLQNVTLLQAAVSDRIGAVGFAAEDNSTGAIAQRGDFITPTFSLDYLVCNQVIPAPDLIKIDVEGAEYLVLEGARLLLNQQKPMLFIALHGAEQKRRCQKALERLDYQIFNLDGSALDTPVLQDDEIYAMPKCFRQFGARCGMPHETYS
jgi:FkbM family methyltransferase